mmetsp:Transcript_844/g.950  ORF Transcript_844/g.950 Transcript_844/m.950 type:complete len:152 (-) Transcript_844:70-525(-)|eukprot:CAMPEP_0119053908 /NCGR_PEP_ID=MMETSP1177-20130426/74723_1 /TAXON_ID=2985 /ORGANISM="Ochromonas sp, Strain CCMP1899" /LENGTH=151 /DNA_ID=CAMNT_0007033983 /DNA_START=157 /DNA_END=615 /DNA_ORIENTATION=-
MNLFTTLAIFLTILQCISSFQAISHINRITSLHTSNLKGITPKGVDTSIVEIKVIVSGSAVQGPWYRTTVRMETVFNRKLKGLLTEKEDDTTEIRVQGPKNRVDSWVKWLKKGPGLGQMVTVGEIDFLEEITAELTANVNPFTEDIRTPKQ